MKRLLLYTVFFFCAVFGYAQNLVPNPSFEDTSYCVTGSAQMPAALGWDSYAESPDYFNPCTSDPSVSVPYNWGGYQQPASGNAYGAFGTYSSAFGQMNVREFIGTPLSTPLSIGTKYYVSFKVSLSISSAIWTNCATNNIGAGFSTVPFHWSTNPLAVNNNPKVYSNSIITDTVNWTTIFGSFTADSTYQYIILGNLFDDLNTDTLIVDASASPYPNCAAYYYVDDICVSSDSIYAANYVYTGIDEELVKTDFKVFPNPVQDYLQIKRINTKPYDVIIFNSLGQKLYQEENIALKSKIIDTTPFGNGVLLILIKSSNQLTKYKLLKQ